MLSVPHCSLPWPDSWKFSNLSWLPFVPSLLSEAEPHYEAQLILPQASVLELQACNFTPALNIYLFLFLREFRGGLELKATLQLWLLRCTAYGCDSILYTPGYIQLHSVLQGCQPLCIGWSSRCWCDVICFAELLPGSILMLNIFWACIANYLPKQY